MCSVPRIYIVHIKKKFPLAQANFSGVIASVSLTLWQSQQQRGKDWL